MSETRQIEVFSAGCPACKQAIDLVRSVACPSCEVHVLDMHDPQVATKAASYGIQRVPAVVIEGRLADCCQGAGVDEATLRRLGIGAPFQN